MFSLRVASGDVYRLDAEYYDPRAVQEDAKVRSSPFELFGQLIEEGYRVVYHGVDDANAVDGVPFLAPTDISEGGDYEISDIKVRLPRYYIDDYPKGIARSGELLIEVKGNTEKVAVVGMGDQLFLVSGSLYKATLRNGIDSRFVLSYLRSRSGNILKRRVVSNVNISYLGKDDLYAIPVPSPHNDAQRYIGSKVRQAEMLRERAKVLIEQINDAYVAAAPPFRQGRERHVRVEQNLLRERLDAGHYPDSVVRMFATVQSSSYRLHEVAAAVFSGSTLPETNGNGVLQATVATLDSVFLKDKYRVVRSPRDDGRRLLTHDLAIAAAAHTGTFIGRDVTYVVADQTVIPSTEVMIIRPDRNVVPSSWVWRFLKSELGYRQLQSCVRGISAHVYPDDVREILVPLPSKDVADVFRKFDDDMVLAYTEVSVARSLITAARLLVEALIERKITEAELIAAAADPAKDRVVLGRLKTGGLDGGGEALFADVDGLVELLNVENRS